MRKWILLLVFLVGYGVQDMVGGISHPAMLHSKGDIDRVRQHLSQEPLKSAYLHLCQSSYAQTRYKHHTSALLDGYLKRMDYNNWGPEGRIAQYADYSNYTALMYDAAACYQLALRYQLSGSTEYAAAAVAILNAWKNDCKGLLRMEGYTNNIPDPNEYLIMIQVYQLANAAELLRDYTGWKAADFTAFKEWMRSTFYEVAHLFLTNHSGNQGSMHSWLNWDLAQMTAILSIGILCDDQTLIDEAIGYFKGNDVSRREVGYIRNAVPFIHQDPDSQELLGQCEESGRDQGHATLCVSLMGAFCQMARNVGEDLFAYDNYRALKMAEYVGKYNLIRDERFLSTSLTDDDFTIAHDDMPYTAYSNPSYSCPVIPADDSSRGSKRPAWELWYGYAKSNGLSARYCQHWAEQMRQYNSYGCDGGGGDYGSNSSGFDQLGYGSLMYAVFDDQEADGNQSVLYPSARFSSSSLWQSASPCIVRSF